MFRGASKLEVKAGLDRKNIELSSVLGTGHFGEVYKGICYGLEFEEPLHVAVKTCKSGSNEEASKKFLQEADTMLKFRHEHIVRITGVCRDNPVWIVMELARYGELSAYLRNNRDILNLEPLLLYIQQLSSALQYLDRKRYVHRDVAARNVLVMAEDCVKLGDFGLCRRVDEDFSDGEGKMPVKWMAPESINYRQFTTASDVWMFGVCMWEITSLGGKPFWNVKNDDVMTKIEFGERLHRPHMCPRTLYMLMLRCWNYVPSKRPKMEEICGMLRKLRVQAGPWGTDEVHLEETPPPKPPRTFKTDYSLLCQRPKIAARSKSKPASFNLPTLVENTIFACDRRRQPEIESKYIEETIQRQKRECEEDAKWLQETEHSFFACI